METRPSTAMVTEVNEETEEVKKDSLKKVANIALQEKRPEEEEFVDVFLEQQKLQKEEEKVKQQEPKDVPQKQQQPLLSNPK